LAELKGSRKMELGPISETRGYIEKHGKIVKQKRNKNRRKMKKIVIISILVAVLALVALAQPMRLE